jgi:hypothetical protein
MQGIEIPIGAPLGKLNQDLDGAQKSLKGFTSSAESNLKGFSSTASTAFKSVGLALAGAFSVGAFVSFGKEVLAVTAEFEKFGAVLGNTLGSDALAKLKLKEIEEFAAKTPFSVNELTSSYVKLANQGFKPTGDEMRKLGDLAASTGKSFNQLAEAIIDAQTGELERLKEFGIISQQSGDKVIFTFKGVQTTVDKSSEAIRNYVISLGNLEGVTGATAVISETLTGKISNLSDTWNQMLVSVGSNTSGVFTGVIDIISKTLNKITDFNKSLNIVSKFKLKSDFGEKLNRAINPFADKGSTSTEKAIYAIKQADNEVTKFVSGALAGAKSTSDFGTAIADLQKKGNAMIADFKMFAPQALAGIKTTYEEGIKALMDGRKAFEIEANKPVSAGFGKKTGKTDAEKLVELSKDLKDTKLDNYLNGLDIAFKTAAQGLEVFKDAFPKDTKKTFSSLTDKPLLDISKLLDTKKFIDPNFGKELYTPFQILQESIKFDLLPQLETSFKTFFDDILMNGKFSFSALGQAIKNTFLSVLASEATKGVMNLLVGGGKGENGKGGGLISGVLGLVGGGGKGGGGGGLLKSIGGLFGAGAAATGGAGGAGALAAGTAATGGALLPILAGVAAVASIASLFKKKPQAPLPQASSTISTSAAGSSQNFGGGAVVFEISGTNLIGVLNRAGAKLTRFGP